jgi:uncharacterized metal-binding protein
MALQSTATAKQGKAMAHRSPLSHWPLVGTAGRLLYLSIPLIIMGFLSGGGLFVPLGFLLPFLPLVFLGLALSDLGHFIADL